MLGAFLILGQRWCVVPDSLRLHTSRAKISLAEICDLYHLLQLASCSNTKIFSKVGMFLVKAATNHACEFSRKTAPSFCAARKQNSIRGALGFRSVLHSASAPNECRLPCGRMTRFFFRPMLLLRGGPLARWEKE